MSRLLIAAMLVLLSGTVGVVAQETAGVQLRILSFGRITGPEELLLVDPKEPEGGSEVRLHLNNFTGPYRAKSRALVLVDPAGVDGDKPAEPVAKIVLPASLGSRLPPSRPSRLPCPRRLPRRRRDRLGRATAGSSPLASAETCGGEAASSCCCSGRPRPRPRPRPRLRRLRRPSRAGPPSRGSGRARAPT